MLSITRKADYALIAMADLAQKHPSVVSTRDLSERRCIPIPVLRKILTMLAGSKLVVSIQGPTGGYRLGRPPGEITLANVIAAIEGPFRFVDCVDAAGGRARRACEQKSACPVIWPMRKVHDLLEQCLAGVSIADLASDMVPGAVMLRRGTDSRRRRGASER